MSSEIESNLSLTASLSRQDQSITATADPSSVSYLCAFMIPRLFEHLHIYITCSQQSLYVQLTGGTETMPEKSRETMEQQTMELKKAAKDKLALVVLDEYVFVSTLLHLLIHGVCVVSCSIWNADHEAPFDCLDEKTASKLLVVSSSGTSLFVVYYTSRVLRRRGSRAS